MFVKLFQLFKEFHIFTIFGRQFRLHNLFRVIVLMRMLIGIFYGWEILLMVHCNLNIPIRGAEKELTYSRLREKGKNGGKMLRNFSSFVKTSG